MGTPMISCDSFAHFYHASIVEFVVLLVLLDILVHRAVEGYKVNLVAVDQLQAIEDGLIIPRPPACRRCEVNYSDAMVMVMT